MDGNTEAGPEVRESPSVWYFGIPIALSRLAKVRA
jgi:hypothetical protein